MSTDRDLHVVVIGAGRADLVTDVVGGLADKPGFAVVVGGPAPGLADALRQVAAMPVVEVDATPIALAHDRVYVARPGRETTFERGELATGASMSRTSGLDGLLRAIADHVGPNAVGVVLGGAGTEGALGLKRLKEAGGLTIAQDLRGDDGEMPRAAIGSGLVDLVLPVDRIAPHLLDSTRRAVASAELDDARGTEQVTETLRDILTLVRVRSGHDFSSYKYPTLYRRIARRMQVCDCDSIAGYHSYLRDHPSELGHLLRDFLISVTNFFRDREAFEALARDVIPQLFAHKAPTDQVRVWIAGCATGEEAYSIGMLLLEHAARLPSPPHIQIFATDIDDAALAEARQGCYPLAIASDVSPERLGRFFTIENGQYRIAKELRELVLFSPHNLLRDPPFSRLDLVSCRNLLIYLGRDAQARVLSMFHFGLRAQGYLFLGSSESAEGSTFGPEDPKARIFVRRSAPSSLGDALPVAGRWQPQIATPQPGHVDRVVPVGELHYRIVEQYAPPSALVNAELDVVHFSEHAGRFMTLSGGEPTRQVLRLVHPALRLDLRTAIYAARQRGSATRSVRFDDDGTSRAVEMRARMVEAPDLGQGALLITFDELGSDAPPAASEAASDHRPASPDAVEPVVREIEDELERTRDQLRATIEQYETSVEELKASNEELQAINEELRSATEELETSKEELQSVNEELTTLNHELKVKIDEVSHVNADLQNLMTSTEIGVVFLDRALNIKRFTPRAADLFNVIPSDIGRPLSHLTHRLEAVDLSGIAHSVLQSLRPVERTLPSRDGRSYLARWLPYRSMEDRIDGVVLTFVDVTDLRDAVVARRRSEHALVEVEERLKAALHAAPITVVAFDDRAQPTWAYVLGREMSLDERISIVSPPDAVALREIVRDVIAQQLGRRVELDVVLDGTPRTFDFRVEPMGAGASAVGFDITPSKLAEMSLRDADRRKDEFLATLSHELRNPLAPLQVALDVAKLVDHDPVQREESLTIMTRQVAMLSGLVDELLDLSRITQSKIVLDRAPLELATLLERALEMTRPALAAHHLTVDVPDAPVQVYGDPRRLVQAFVNLLTNAARYTPSDGHVTVTVAPAGARARVTVADDGIGIAPTMLPHIFEIFVQVRDESGRSRGGLGIGLNVVRRLVELHGGSVAADSAGPGKGSTFTIELPRIED